jgi:hypothetical protein
MIVYIRGRGKDFDRPKFRGAAAAVKISVYPVWGPERLPHRINLSRFGIDKNPASG